jgi:hypothetical protein
MAKKKVEVAPEPEPVKKKAAKEASEPRPKFGHDVRIIGVPDENWRREGTANFKRADEVMAFMKKNPRASVAELIAGTSYRRNDFEWDLEREVFKTAKV